MDLEQLTKLLCKGAYSSLHLSFNSHKSSYRTLKQAMEDQPDYYDSEDFVSPNEMQRAIESDTVWTLQWYPNTPVGFNVMHAHSLEALLKAAADAVTGR